MQRSSGNSTKQRPDFSSYTEYAFTPKQVDALIQACSTTADHVMILIGVRYGLRRDDLVNLKIADFDYEGRTLSYYEQKKKKIRTVPVEADAAGVIKRHIAAMPLAKKRKGYILPFHDGSTAWAHLQALCNTAGIPPTNRPGGYHPIHALRGTCIKMRMKQGWSLEEVAALIGDTPGTVSKHYAKVSMSELAEKMNGASDKP